MVSQKRDTLLSAKEKEKLVTRRALDPRDRAANDIRVKRKLAAWLRNATDAELILEHLPENQTGNIIEDIDIFSLLYAVERMMEIKKFRPVAGPIESTDKWMAVVEEKITKPAENEDIWRSQLLGEHLNRLDRFYDRKNSPIDRVLNLKKLDDIPDLKDRITEKERAAMEKIEQVSADIVNKARDQMIKAYDPKKKS